MGAIDEIDPLFEIPERKIYPTKNPQLLVDWGKRELRTCDSSYNLTPQDFLRHLPLDRYGN